MKILIDTNIILDVALNRPGLSTASASVLRWGFDRPGSTVMAWHSIATLAYFLSNQGTTAQARSFIRSLASRIAIIGGQETEMLRAMNLKMNDLEDAMVAVVAETTACDYIVTRNITDFQKSPVKAITPEIFLSD